jgi:hypothetical protein
MAYKVLKLTDATGRAVGLATVSQDVTERRRLEDDLPKLAADLCEADRRKDEFLAMLAHELRADSVAWMLTRCSARPAPGER